MKKLCGLVILFSMLSVPWGAHAANPGEGKWVAENVFRSVNTGGLTGLIHMDSAYTVRGGEVQVTTGFTTESGGGVDYQSIPLALTFGVGDNKEWALVSRYINPSVGTAGMGGTGGRAGGTGGTGGRYGRYGRYVQHVQCAQYAQHVQYVQYVEYVQYVPSTWYN